MGATCGDATECFGDSGNLAPTPQPTGGGGGGTCGSPADYDWNKFCELCQVLGQPCGNALNLAGCLQACQTQNTCQAQCFNEVIQQEGATCGDVDACF